MYSSATAFSEEGLSMSETEDELMPEHSELNKLLSDLDIDLKLKSAAQRGETVLIKELLSNGAQVVADESGSTAIHVAAQNGFAEVARLLLEHGTDVDLPDSNGYTALHKAAGQGHLDVLELLINEGCDIDTQDDLYGNTPLHEAAWCGYSKSVDLLLKNKSNAFITNRAGCTPLHLAAQNGHNQSGRTLLYGGCSPDVKNNYGDTPLHTAARYGHAGIARILISARCSIEEQNKNGDTALHITAAFKRRKIAKLLIEGGIGHSVRNKQDETAVDIAQRKGHTDIIDIIFQSHKQPMYSTAQQHDDMPFVPTDKAEPTVEKEAKKKSHNAFVTWIRKRFSKKSSHSTKQTHPKDGYNGEEGAPSVKNQYVKKPGFAYYRDLAGNIRQGPCGFVPAGHTRAEDPGLLDDQPFSREELDYTDAKERQRLMARKRRGVDATNESMFRERAGANGSHGEIMGRKLHHLNKAEKDQLEINRQLAQVKNDFQELKGDLNTWLSMQAEDGGVISEEDPFAYAIGRSQARFGDDFDHERMARYDVSEQFPPPPRLFRCRSDETLSHSEYSYHGRAFKSREAAMEELKTLKHHEELRAIRKRIRAAGDEHEKTMYEHTSDLPAKSSTQIQDRRSKVQTTRWQNSKPSLWQSRENIRQKDILSQRDPEVIDNQPLDKSAMDNGKENLTTNYSRYDGLYRPEPKSVSTQQSSIPKLDCKSGQPSAFQLDKNPDLSSQQGGKSSCNRFGNKPNIYITSSTGLRQHCDLPSSRHHDNLPIRQLRDTPNTRQPSHAPTSNIQQDNRQATSLSAIQQQNIAGTSKTRFAETNGSMAHASPSGIQKAEYLYSESSKSSALVTTRPQLQHKTSSCQISPARLPLPTYQQAKATQNTVKNLSTGFNPQTSQTNVQQTDASSVEISHDSNFTLANGHQTALPAESCCASSNPDSGYGGQSYDFYTSRPTQVTGSSQINKDYEGWYSRRLQDAARRINAYSDLRPKRTMTSDV
ncbi:uncharacterized protein [Watersipora subatra]|uniref:uncharacterized protein isoform X2 n=1 Tax=Watersipora subatra TaxID=2589382 RepID=UPI00355B6182